MKSFNIKGYLKDGQHYRVHLGNGTVHHFTSIRATKNFLAVTNRFLNDRLVSLNLILRDTYPISREIWIINQEADFDRRTAALVSSIEDFLRLAIFKAPLKSGNYYAFIDLRKGAEVLQRLITHLQSFELVRTMDTTKRHHLASLQDRATAELTRLMAYAKDEAVETFSTSHMEDISSISQLKIA